MSTPLSVVPLPIAAIVEVFRKRGLPYDKAQLAADVAARRARALRDVEPATSSALSEAERAELAMRLAAQKKIPLEQARASIERVAATDQIVTLSFAAIVRSYQTSGHTFETAQQLADRDWRRLQRAAKAAEESR